MIRHQFGQVELASEQWFRLAAAILAGATRTPGIATPAKPATARVRRIDIVSIWTGSPAWSSCSPRARSGRSSCRSTTTDRAGGPGRVAVVLNEIMAGRTARTPASARSHRRAAPIGALVELVGQRVLAR